MKCSKCGVTCHSEGGLKNHQQSAKCVANIAVKRSKPTDLEAPQLQQNAEQLKRRRVLVTETLVKMRFRGLLHPTCLNDVIKPSMEELFAHQQDILKQEIRDAMQSPLFGPSAVEVIFQQHNKLFLDIQTAFLEEKAANELLDMGEITPVIIGKRRQTVSCQLCPSHTHPQLTPCLR